MRVINALIRFVTGLFALVLVLYIILVLAGANFGNAFAGFVRDFASTVDFGLGNLFTFDSEQLSLALSYGLAALLWLIIGAGLSVLIARISGPGRTRVLRRRLRG